MKRNENLKNLTGWLLLLGFVCTLMVPSLASASVKRRNGNEGDPGDGNESTGGSGSGGGVLPPNANWNPAGATGRSVVAPLAALAPGSWTVRFVADVVDGMVVYRLEITSMERRK